PRARRVRRGSRGRSRAARLRRRRARPLPSPARRRRGHDGAHRPVRDNEIIADADATIAHLRAMKETRVTDLAVLGFCMGGRITYLLAAARPAAWRAAGVFYGGNIMKAWGDGPAPFDLTQDIRAPPIG